MNNEIIYNWNDRRPFVALGVVWFILFFSAACFAGPAKRVLFISSYHPAFPTFSQQVNGIKSIFDDQDVRLDMEYMDTKRFPQKEQWILFQTALNYKLRHSSPYDAIIAGDDNALTFAVEQRDKLFKDIPIVFLGVNNIQRALEQNGDSQITGVVEAVSIGETIEVMSILFPEAKRILAIVDQTPSGQGDLKKFYQAGNPFQSLEFGEVSLAEKTWPEFLAALHGIEDDSVLLLLSAYKDKNNKTYPFDESLEKIKGALNLPIFHLWFHGIGDGLVGGKVISHFEQGRATAQIVKKIFSGTLVSQIQVKNKSPNKYVFDYLELKRHHIDYKLLPKDSLILNEPDSFYGKNTKLIWLVVLIFGLLSAALFVSFVNILRRRKVEQRLKRNEAKYRRILESAMDGFWLTDTDGRLVEVNAAYARMSGYSESRLLEMSISDLDGDQTPERVARGMKNVISSGWERFESRHRRKDGTAFDVEVSAQFHRVNGGVFTFFLRDITDQKQAELALQDSEKKWRNVLENTPQIGISLNRRAEVTFVNDSFLALTGWEESQVLGQNWFDRFIPRNIREDVRTVFHNAMEKKNTPGLSRYENEILGKSGEVFNIAWSNVLTKDAQGLVVDVTCLGVDLTERKRAENRLKKSEAKYRTIMEATKDPVYISSQAHIIQYMNQAMIDRIGDDATGQLCYRALHGYDTPCKWCQHDKKFEIGHTEKNIFSPLDHRHFHVSSTVFASEDKVLSKLCVFRDTTELIELQNRLQQAQKMEAIGNLAGGIAHDFNNILFPIIGRSEMMKEDLLPGSLEREHAKEINKAGHRAKELVAQILAFSRQSDQELHFVKFQSVLKEVIKLCRSTIPVNIKIEQNIQRDCGPVRGNATQLHQIGMNLITNAYHAIEEKNGKIQVALEQIDNDGLDLRETILNPGKYLLLTVSDDGMGMTEEIKNKIFEPYFTTKEQGKGTGLGLSVVYGIVKEYGGEIEVETQIGSGTHFKIYLPVIEQSEKKGVSKTSAGLETGCEHILLVDDEPAVAGLEKQILERLGYQVTSLTGSLDAVALFRSAPAVFDMVITDMTMPEMTGDYLAKEILSIRPEIPIIICTGFSERINKEHAEAIGIKGFLMKPVVQSDLAKMVRKMLDDGASKNC